MDRTSTRISIGLLFISIQALKYLIYGRNLQEWKILRAEIDWLKTKSPLKKLDSGYLYLFIKRLACHFGPKNVRLISKLPCFDVWYVLQGSKPLVLTYSYDD